MEYRVTRTNQDELYHYGVKGMKWGVRRYRDKTGRLTAKGKQHYDKHNSNDEASKKTNNKFHLTDKQKKAIKIGAAFAATALVAYGTYKFAKSGQFNNVKLKKQKTKLPIAENLKAVNPKFNPSVREYSMNCGNCTIAAELRMRGFDVEALGNPNGLQLSQFGEYFKNFKSESFIDMTVDYNKINKFGKSKAVKDTITSNLTKQYSGDARGALFFPHTMGNHFIYWTKNGNSIQFHDGQNPAVDMNKLFSMYKDFSEMHTIRLDDLDINTDNIKNVVKNVGDRVNISKEFDVSINKGKNFVMKWA